jgi:hypothetical protein
VEIVALIEDLAIHVGVKLSDSSHLLVLLGDQLLVHRRDLDEEIVFRKVEIGCEELGRYVVVVPCDRKRARLVFPGHTVEVK